MILPLDSIMESKRKSETDNDAKTSCKVMPLDEKIKIQVARWYERSSSWSSIPLIFCFKAQLPVDILR
jgi:hypothetical protein